MDTKQITIIGAGSPNSSLADIQLLHDVYPGIMSKPLDRRKPITCAKCKSRDQLRKVNNTYICRQCFDQKTN